MARDISLRLSKFRRRFARPKGTKRIGVLPSLMTLGNLLCGFLAIVEVANGSCELGAWLILAAMVFDALDGKLARMTQATTDFGAQLDSLSDVITFGAAPAFLVSSMSSFLPSKLPWLVGAMFLISVALRLARFNVENQPGEEHHRFFKGLPSPAAAGFVASLVILYFDLLDWEYQLGILVWGLPFVSLAVSALMISGVRYVHVLNAVFQGQKRFEYLVILVFMVFFVALTYPFSLALFFGVYVVSGLYTMVRMRLAKPVVEGTQSEGALPAPRALEAEPSWRTAPAGDDLQKKL